MKNRKRLPLNKEMLDRLWRAKTQAPQRWPSLPPDLAARAKAVWNRVKPWWAPTYEPFEFQLTKDEHPDVEITAWERMGDAMEVYMSSHPTADRSWVQDILCMVCLGMAPTKDMPPKRRKMFKELRRLYLRCGGKIKPITFTRAASRNECASGDSVPDVRSLPAMPIEDVGPADIMTAEWIIARDRQSLHCVLLYPNSMPSPDNPPNDLDREAPMLLIEFEQQNEHHKRLIDNIIKIAKGEA